MLCRFSLLPFRYCFEIATLLSALEFLLLQQGEEIKNSGMKSFLKNLVSHMSPGEMKGIEIRFNLSLLGQAHHNLQAGHYSTYFVLDNCRVMTFHE